MQVLIGTNVTKGHEGNITIDQEKHTKQRETVKAGTDQLIGVWKKWAQLIH
jgi:hypothetical protein